MLMHEWIRYRKQQVKQAEGDGAETATAEETAEEPEDAAEAEAAEATAAEAGEPEAAPAAEEEPEAAASEAEEAEPEEDEAQAAAPDAESTLRDREAVLSSLQEELDRAGNSMKERLSQLQARQKQLPIDIEEMPEEDEDEGKSRKATETRQELVQRLLDPTLTLREAALLIDVCPTTVRRYTNRGLLNCFRTPGNQRRFHLSDILEFLERRERGEV